MDTAAELVQLLAGGDGEDTYDGALFGSRGHHSAVIVHGYARQRRAMGTTDTDDLTSQCIVYDDLAGGGGDIGGERRRMGGAPLGRLFPGLWHGQGEVAVFRGGRESAYSTGIGRSVDGEEQGHVLDVVDVDDIGENDGEASAVEADSEDRGGKGQLAYDGGPLVEQDRRVSATGT